MKLVVLRKNPDAHALLLEAGSIINRDEELKMESPERQDIISSGVAGAVKEFCASRSATPADVAAKAPSQSHPAESSKARSRSTMSRCQEHTIPSR